MKKETAEKPNRGKILFQTGDLQLNLMNMKISFSVGSLHKMINDGFQTGETRPLLTGKREEVLEERGVVVFVE